MDIFKKKRTFFGHFDMSTEEFNLFSFCCTQITRSMKSQSPRRADSPGDHFLGRYPRRGAKKYIPARVKHF